MPMQFFLVLFVLFFLCNDTATTEIYTYGHTLSLHDALPISVASLYTADETHEDMAPNKSKVGAAAIAAAARSSATSASATRSEEHTSELQSLMRISYAVFCLKKKK